MRKKRINISIISVILILACVLAGIVLYGNELLHREMFNYGWQMSRTVHSGIAQASRRDFAAFEAANDSLVDAFIRKNGDKIDSGSLDLDSARALISAHKMIYNRYFRDQDSVRSLLAQAGLDTAVDLRVEIGYFVVLPHNRDLSPVFDSVLRSNPSPVFDSVLRSNPSQVFDSVLRGTPGLRTISGGGPPQEGPEFFTRGIRVRGENFRVDYRAFIHPTRFREDIFHRVLPNFIFLVLAFLAIGFFSLFTIRTMLKQQRISDQKTDFINNITHEFNTPLATIGVASRMLKDASAAGDGEKIRSLALMVDRQNNILQEMVASIMQFSDGSATPQAELPLIHPRQELTRILEEFRVLCQGQNVQVSSRLDIPPEAAIRMETAVFSNVVSNMLDNSLKYRSDRRPPVVTVVAVSQGGIMEISVSDNGLGMKKDQLKYIFDKFYRIPSGDLHSVKGMGLGLYFVKKNVESAGGKIRVESKWGEGSTFILRFPLTA